MPNLTVTILDRAQDGWIRKVTDPFGELLYEIDLEADEGREIEIAFAGIAEVYNDFWNAEDD